MKYIRTLAVSMVSFALALASGIAQAQTASSYPQKPVHMIVPFAPGGASDFAGRIISPRLSEVLGQQVVIDNRPGASGNIGMEAAAKASADGYTIYLGNIGTISINPAVFPSLAVHPAKDFIPVSLVAELPSILVAHPGLPANTVGELVALAKSKPGDLNFASPGSSTMNRLEMELLIKAAGLKMVHVPYKGGAGPAVMGLLGNETHVMFVTLSSAITFVKAGRLKALAVTSSKRIEALPQVPTMAEAGYPDLVTSSWQGVFVPAGTPHAVVAKLHEALVKVLAMPEVKERFAAGGVTATSSKTPEDFAAYVAAESERWGKVARESGATID
ncbi:MAG TPA: tripartite tricarboxylate transporter substrate binding protein [Burkholderiales bacterium]